MSPPSLTSLDIHLRKKSLVSFSRINRRKSLNSIPPLPSFFLYWMSWGNSSRGERSDPSLFRPLNSPTVQSGLAGGRVLLSGPRYKDVMRLITPQSPVSCLVITNLSLTPNTGGTQGAHRGYTGGSPGGREGVRAGPPGISLDNNYWIFKNTNSLSHLLSIVIIIIKLIIMSVSEYLD